jgi:tripartite ATP-independent transporter DctM subunit
MVEMSPQLTVVVMFSFLLLSIFMGFPLGFSLFGVALVVGFINIGAKTFAILYTQAFGVFTNYTLVAVPLFVFMGVMIEESGIGGALFNTLEIWLYRLRGHLALVVVLTGTALAACTGIIAGSVVMLGMVALPHMMKRGYNKELACGAICAGGTLGILIPPSVMLVVYGATAEISVGRLFMGAFGAGFTLSALYLLYIAVLSFIKPSLAPTSYEEHAVSISLGRRLYMLLTSVFPIAFLILAVLGSIFLGVAAPTEAAAVGAFVATLLALGRRGLTWRGLKKVALECTKVTGMIAIVAIGALAFTGVLLRLGGGRVVAEFIMSAPGGKWGVWATVMVIVFILGMFIDWLGIVFIVVPLVTPIAPQIGFNPLWFALSICVNLQMAFMSPPFALAIYFLKGVIPPEYGITTAHIIRGVVPFIILIWIGLGLMVAFPQIILWLPSQMIRGF